MTYLYMGTSEIIIWLIRRKLLMRLILYPPDDIIIGVDKHAHVEIINT